MADSMHFQYAIYLPNAAHNANPLAAVNDELKKFPELKLVDEIPAHPQQMFVHAYIQKHVKGEYAPPGIESLRYSGHGLTLAEGHELQACERALILEFGHPRNYVWTGLRQANTIVDDLVRRARGFAWDEETREVFSIEAWHERRSASWNGDVPDVSFETTIHIYDNNGSVRAVSLGMSKIGLPDITMSSSGWSNRGEIVNLINILSQCLAEGKPIPSTGDVRLDLLEVKNTDVLDRQLKSRKGKGYRAACLTLKPGQREEGDPKNRLIQLQFDRYPGTDENARQESMISSFFGAEDSISRIKDNDELLAASAKAKTKLPELQKAFSAGLEAGEFISVKAPFKTENGGNEWMWVEVTKWKGDEIEGILDNDPEDVPGLHAGEKVKVRQQDVFDYLRHFSDKRMEGNTTGAIIRKMTEGEDGPTPIVSVVAVPECGN